MIRRGPIAVACALALPVVAAIACGGNVTEPSTAASASESAPAPAPAPAPAATVQPEATVDDTKFNGKQVRGRIAPEKVKGVVDSNLATFRRCYEDARRSNPKLQGKVTVKFVIDEQGRVSSSSDVHSDLPDPGVVQCVVEGYRSLRFPKPDGGNVTVYFPLIFNPG